MIRLRFSVSFRDDFQEWTCADCFAVWFEPNGVLASEMKDSFESGKESV